ncbi:DUF4148 domain-containing protein [Caballeronia sp. GAOx1]|uniref:DUF4148 domain-containing protein n=1 Tax=Caballeronia sp. GAOx1 TaxID=2921761 RepID=UPI002027A6A8|nr:DUF4148 domain-containing protein [Caballeronia sp. GAOx1]
MKKQLSVLLIATLLAPLASFAHGTESQLTREQVKEDLVKLEAAGYRPVASDWNYPDSLEAAEAKVAALELQQNAYGDAGAATQTGGHSAASGQ